MRTGERLVVPRYLGAYVSVRDYDRRTGRYTRGHGLGQGPGLFPLWAETKIDGDGRFMRWLTIEELRATHRPYRPSSKGRVPLPLWVTKGEFNDFIYNSTFWCSFAGARGNQVALVGMIPGDQKFEHWSTCRYALIFIDSADVRERLVPKYRDKVNKWDGLDRVQDALDS